MIEDQLTSVRELVKEEKKKKARCQIITVASGKGGVGKTNVAVNVAISMAQMGKRVLLVDADNNLANVDLLLGVTPTNTMQELLLGEKELSEVIFTHSAGMDVLPSCSGLGEMLMAQGIAAQSIMQHLGNLKKNYDYILVDTAASLTQDIIDYMTFADDVLVVTTPEPTAIADAYALIKVLHRNKPNAKIYIVFNMVESESEAREVMERFALVVSHFLDREVVFAGYIVADWNISKAVKSQNPFILSFPESEASECMRQIAHNLIKQDAPIITDEA